MYLLWLALAVGLGVVALQKLDLYKRLCEEVVGSVLISLLDYSRFHKFLPAAVVGCVVSFFCLAMFYAIYNAPLWKFLFLILSLPAFALVAAGAIVFFLLKLPLTGLPLVFFLPGIFEAFRKHMSYIQELDSLHNLVDAKDGLPPEKFAELVAGFLTRTAVDPDDTDVWRSRYRHKQIRSFNDLLASQNEVMQKRLMLQRKQVTEQIKAETEFMETVIDNLKLNDRFNN